MRYNDITRRYFEADVNVGTLSGSGVHRGVAGHREHGTQVQFDVQISAGRAHAVRFQAFGCPHTIAVCAFLAATAEGCAVGPALVESPEALMQRFGIPKDKRGRLLVIEDAWRAAVLG